MKLLICGALLFELALSIQACICIYGMFRATRSVQDAIDNEWSSVGVCLGAILGSFCSVFVFWGWGLNHWWVHIPLFIVLIRFFIIMKWNK